MHLTGTTYIDTQRNLSTPRSPAKFDNRNPRPKTKRRRKQQARMNSFIDRVMNGRICKRLTEFVCGETHVSRNYREITSINEIHDQVGVPGDTDSLQKPALASKTSPRPSLDGSPARDAFSTNIHNSLASGTEIVIDYPREVNNEQQGISATAVESRDPPPITGQHLRMFTFATSDGELSCGLELTKTFLWELNYAFRFQNKISNFNERYHVLENRQVTLQSMIQELNDLVDNSNEEERASLLRGLDDAEQMHEETKQERTALEQEVQNWRDESQQLQSKVFTDLKRVLDENNLLEDISDRKGDEDAVVINKKDPITYVMPPPPTPSEAARHALLNAQDASVERAQEKEIHLQNARDKMENWNDYYDTQYQEYCRWKEEENMETTKSEFDVILLREEQAATRAFIQAEQEFVEAKEHARELGVTYDPFDQESGFFDHVDDGYRESLEAAFAGHVDRGRIERWMDEENKSKGHSTECDDWDSKSVEMCDSISVVAEGKERNRIDHWRAECELQQLEVEAQVKENENCGILPY